MAWAPSPASAQGTTERIALPREHRGKPVTVTGELLLPPGTGRVPAMVIHHGSGGVSAEREGRYAREMLDHSPTALRFLKAAFMADTDGLAGLQQLAGDATLLYYMTDEAKEGRNAFLERRKPDFSRFPRLP